MGKHLAISIVSHKEKNKKHSTVTLKTRMIYLFQNRIYNDVNILWITCIRNIFNNCGLSRLEHTCPYKQGMVVQKY